MAKAGVSYLQTHFHASFARNDHRENNTLPKEPPRPLQVPVSWSCSLRSAVASSPRSSEEPDTLSNISLLRQRVWIKGILYKDTKGKQRQQTTQRPKKQSPELSKEHFMHPKPCFGQIFILILRWGGDIHYFSRSHPRALLPGDSLLLCPHACWSPWNGDYLSRHKVWIHPCWRETNPLLEEGIYGLGDTRQTALSLRPAVEYRKL